MGQGASLSIVEAFKNEDFDSLDGDDHIRRALMDLIALISPEEREKLVKYIQGLGA